MSNNKKLETPRPTARKPAEDGSDSHLWTPLPERWVPRDRYTPLAWRVIDRFHRKQDRWKHEDPRNRWKKPAAPPPAWWTGEDGGGR